MLYVCVLYFIYILTDILEIAFYIIVEIYILYYHQSSWMGLFKFLFLYYRYFGETEKTLKNVFEAAHRRY